MGPWVQVYLNRLSDYLFTAARYVANSEVPYQKLIVPDVPHSAAQIYQQETLTLMRFHARNFGLID